MNSAEPTLGLQPMAPLASPVRAGRCPASAYLGELAEGSRRTMQQALGAIADLASGGRADALTLPWGELRREHTTAIRAALGQRYAPATANKMLSALRGVLRAAFRLGQMEVDSYQQAVDVRNVKGDTRRAGRSLTADELNELHRACGRDSGPAGVRDAALIALTLSAGPRRAELVGLNLADLDQASGSLNVCGVGRSADRRIPLPDSALRPLQDWIALRGGGPGPLFCRVGKGAGGEVTLERLSSQAVYQILRRRARQAGVRPFSPDDLRRSFLASLLDAGAGSDAIQQMAGHTSPATASRQLQSRERKERRAADEPAAGSTEPPLRVEVKDRDDWRCW